MPAALVAAAIAVLLAATAPASAQQQPYELPPTFRAGVAEIREQVAVSRARLERDMEVLATVDALEARLERLIYSSPPIAPPAAVVEAALGDVRDLRAVAEADPPMNPFFRQDLVTLELHLAEATGEPAAADWKFGQHQLRLVLADARMLYQLDRRRLEEQERALRRESAGLGDLADRAAAALAANEWVEGDRGGRLPR